MHIHHRPLFKSSNLLKFNDIYLLILGKFMFSYKSNLLPQSFINFFSITDQVHTRNLRSAGQFYIPFCRTVVFDYEHLSVSCILCAACTYFVYLFKLWRGNPISNKPFGFYLGSLATNFYFLIFYFLCVLLFVISFVAKLLNQIKSKRQYACENAVKLWL
jgi:hypothetical protein